MTGTDELLDLRSKLHRIEEENRGLEHELAEANDKNKSLQRDLEDQATHIVTVRKEYERAAKKLMASNERCDIAETRIDALVGQVAVLTQALKKVEVIVGRGLETETTETVDTGETSE